MYCVGERVRQIPSPYGVGGETDYTGQEDLQFINSYNVGGGKDDKGLVFPFLHSKTLLGFICSFILGYHSKFPVNITLKK